MLYDTLPGGRHWLWPACSCSWELPLYSLLYRRARSRQDPSAQLESRRSCRLVVRWHRPTMLFFCLPSGCKKRPDPGHAGLAHQAADSFSGETPSVKAVRSAAVPGRTYSPRPALGSGLPLVPGRPQRPLLARTTSPRTELILLPRREKKPKVLTRTTAAQALTYIWQLRNVANGEARTSTAGRRRGVLPQRHQRQRRVLVQSGSRCR